MSLVFVIQFITGIVGLSVKNDGSYPTNVAEMFEPSFAKKNDTPATTNFYQSHFKCCGWNDYKDYINNKVIIPNSCCKIANCNITAVNANITNNESLINTKGCKDDLVTTIKQVIEGACGILVTMSIFNLMSISLSILLARQIKSGYRYRYS
jgi:hypothetical protein